ncbi:2Fe-2S iron-sulfur cluster-binding protein [Massilia sp. GCM10023247]|uniref:2Fe-2S iron-sulfur cluster-binding protein n=1 Tax=Massilia sp. GCM10023247 TaxID=3252643 RepID=UPI003610D7E4
MAHVTYIESDGTAHKVEVAEGWSLMKGAVHNSVPGIDAECGGACACATCHVYVDDAWMDKLGDAGGAERDLLECVGEPRPNSRLACQIRIGSELDGLVVRMPALQG